MWYLNYSRDIQWRFLELLQWSQSNWQTKQFYFEISYLTLTGQFANALRFRSKLVFCWNEYFGTLIPQDVNRCSIFKKEIWDVAGGTVKSPPANEGGHRFNPWSGKIPHAMEQLHPHATTTDVRAPRACASQQEKPLQWKARVHGRENPHAATKTKCNQKSHLEK